MHLKLFGCTIQMYYLVCILSGTKREYKGPHTGADGLTSASRGALRVWVVFSAVAHSPRPS